MILATRRDRKSQGFSLVFKDSLYTWWGILEHCKNAKKMWYVIARIEQVGNIVRFL